MSFLFCDPMFTPDIPLDLTSSDLLLLFSRHAIDPSSVSKIGRNTFSLFSSSHPYLLKSSLSIFQLRSIVFALDYFSKINPDSLEVPFVLDSVESSPSNCLVLLTYVSGNPLTCDDYQPIFDFLTHGSSFFSLFELSPFYSDLKLKPEDHFFATMSADILHMISSNPLYQPLLSFFSIGPPDKTPCLIHGDLIFQNILRSSVSSSRFCLIDWEFSGVFYRSFDYAWLLVMSCVYQLCDVHDLVTFSNNCPNERYFILFSYLRLLLRLSQVRHRSEVHALQELRFIRMLSRFLDIYDLPSLAYP